MTVPHPANRWHCTRHRQTPADRWGSGAENKIRLGRNYKTASVVTHTSAALTLRGGHAPPPSRPHLAEEGRALLGHLRRVLVKLQRPRELVHEGVGVVGVILCKILHLIFQEHEAVVPSVQLIPNILRNKASFQFLSSLKCCLCVIQNVIR